MKKLSLYIFLILFAFSNLFVAEAIEKKKKKMNDYLNKGWKLLGKPHIYEKGLIRTYTLKKGNNIILCQVSLYMLSDRKEFQGQTLCYGP